MSDRSVAAVYAAAGLSSRFGGEMKALAKIGPNGETLLELSFLQVGAAGCESIFLIVSEQTIGPLKDNFGDKFHGMSIDYCLQQTPDYRSRPYGTTHALLAASHKVDGPFLFLNADDLYGYQAIKAMIDLMTKGNPYVLGGYKLKNVLNDKGTVNRGLVKETNGDLKSIIEQFDISRNDIPGKYTGEECMAMNLFGLHSDFFDFAKKDFDRFIAENPHEKEAELLLPESITRYLKATGKRMKVVKLSDQWYGLTYPEDVEIVRDKLKDLV